MRTLVVAAVVLLAVGARTAWAEDEDPAVEPPIELSTSAPALRWISSASVAFGRDTYLVVWLDERSPESGIDILGVRIGNDGSVLDTKPIEICTDTGDQYDVAVGSNGDDFAVAWRDGGVVKAVRLDAGTAAVTAPVELEEWQDETFRSHPRVIAEGSDYLIAEDWVNGDGYNGTTVFRFRSPALTQVDRFGLTLCAEGCPVTMSSDGAGILATISDTYSNLHLFLLGEDGRTVHDQWPFGREELDGQVPVVTAALPSGYLTIAWDVAFHLDTGTAILGSNQAIGIETAAASVAAFDGRAVVSGWFDPRGLRGFRFTQDGQPVDTSSFHFLPHGTWAAIAGGYGRALAVVVTDDQRVVASFVGHGDGIADDVDNCPRAWNPGQEDSDGDGVGDACTAPEPFPTATPTPVPTMTPTSTMTPSPTSTPMETPVSSPSPAPAGSSGSPRNGGGCSVSTGLDSNVTAWMCLGLAVSAAFLRRRSHRTK